MQVAAPKLLLIDDDECFLRLMSIRLQGDGYEVTGVSNAAQALRLTYNNRFDVVLSDLRMPGMDGLSLFDELLQRNRDLPLILMTAHGTIKDAIAATKRGVFSFITKPIDHQELQKVLTEAVSQSTQKLEPSPWQDKIVTRSPTMLHMLKQAQKIADKNINVHISGALGTGKKLLAQTMHESSARKDEPFIRVNCAALSDDALELQLFGVKQRKASDTNVLDIQGPEGAFIQAHRGTLLLEDVGDISVDLQVKLLNVLQEQRVSPINSSKVYEIDVRIMSTSRQSLSGLVQTGDFRDDLFYLLNVLNFDLPELKDRFEDIPLLAEHFLYRCAAKHNISHLKLADNAVTALTKAYWPGNVQQLDSIIERCVALTTSEIIPATLVEQALSQEDKYWPTLTEARDSFEYEYLCRLLTLTEGNVTKASDLAGRNRSDMHKLMKKHGLVAQEFRLV